MRKSCWQMEGPLYIGFAYRGTRDVGPALALAVHAFVRRVGLLTSRSWAQHIVDRWRNAERDAVSNCPAASQAADIDFAVDIFFSNSEVVAATAA